MRKVSDNLYKDVYSSNGSAFSIDLAYKVANSLQVFLHSDYFTVDGELTLTKEPTTLTILPIEVGLRLLAGKNKFRPYIGLGAGYYKYTEENIIGTMEENKVGFFGEAGLNFYFVKALFLDLKVKYIMLKVDGADGEITLGGLGLFGGIGISF